MVHRLLGHPVHRGVDGLRQAVPRPRSAPTLDEERRGRPGGLRRHPAGADLRAHLRQLPGTSYDASSARRTQSLTDGTHDRRGNVVTAVLVEPAGDTSAVASARAEAHAAAERGAVADAESDPLPTADGGTADTGTADLVSACQRRQRVDVVEGLGDRIARRVPRRPVVPQLL